MRRLTGCIAKHDVGDLDLARSPTPLGSLEHIRRRIAWTLRQIVPFLSLLPVPSSRGVPPLLPLLPLPPLLPDMFDCLRSRLRHQLLFALLDGGQIGADDAFGVAVGLRAPGVEPQRLVAEPFDEVQRMGDEQDGLAAPAEFRELVEALVR